MPLLDRVKSLIGIKPPLGLTVPSQNLPTSSIAPDKGDLQPRGSIPFVRKARISGWGEPPNMAQFLDMERIQSALRAAERGETWLLFSIYRDLILNYAHLQSEWQKRKMTVVGKPYAIIPQDKGNAQDVTAAKAIQQMINGCENWVEGLIHLLDSTLYPVAVCEKIFEPVPESVQYEIPVRYVLKRIDPISYMLMCFKLPYLATGGFGLPNTPQAPFPANTPIQLNKPIDTIYDVDQWEPDLRFFRTFPNGYIDYSWANIYAPDPMRHIVHRGNILSTAIRDNYGGQMRAVMFWWFLSTLGRDWFSRFMERYGSPWPVAKVDAQQKDTLEFMQNAFATATKIGALIIDKNADVILQQAMVQGAAEGYEKFLSICDANVSKIVIGQELSSTAKPTGLGSGVADLQGEVKEEIRQYDQERLGNTLEKQLFAPYLMINGIPGRVPKIVWGGESGQQAVNTSKTLLQLKQAGLEPTDDSIETVSRRVGYDLQRAPEPAPTLGKAAQVNGKAADN